MELICKYDLERKVTIILVKLKMEYILDLNNFFRRGGDLTTTNVKLDSAKYSSFCLFQKAIYLLKKIQKKGFLLYQALSTLVG